MVKKDEQPAAIVGANGDSEKEVKDVDVIAEKQTSDTGAEPVKSNSVQELIAKVKNDPELSESAKLDTLALLVMTFVKENSVLQNEIVIVNETTKKHIDAKEAIKALNVFLKTQISLAKEESELRLQEEKSKRNESMGGYNSTMSELSTLLEAHQGNTNSLKDQNGAMADQMMALVKDTEKREGQIEKMQTEFKLQSELLQHQVAKAQIEKAEVKADMAKERINIMNELAEERGRGLKLDETVKLLKQQADLYQEQMEDLQKGGLDNSKSFQFFKTQIEKLTKQMVKLEKETNGWKEKSEMSTKQVRDIQDSTNKKELELNEIRKKLDTMVKLNKTLNAERVTLLEKVKSEGI